MKLNHLCDEEFIEHLDKHSNDPVILRLCGIFLKKEAGVYNQLLDAGMRDDMTFEYDYQTYEVGEYIKHLENEIDYYYRDANEWLAKTEELKREIKNLKSRSVADLIAELAQDVRNSDARRDAAEREMHRAKEESRIYKEQLGIWNTLKTV